MLTSPTSSSSPSRITSSPSLSSEPSTEPTFEPQPSLDAEYHVPTPNESPLHAVYSHGSDEGSLKLNELTNLVTTLSERIRVLEDDLKKTKQTYSAAFTKLILRIKKLESKVKIGRIDKDPNTYFAQDDEVVHDQDTAAERQPEDSTAGITVITAPINISTARETRSTAGRVLYGRRSKEARKDKGKDLKNKPKLEAQARKNMIVYLKNQKIEKEKKKPAEFQEIEIKQIEKDTTGKRKKSLPRKRTRSTTKRQKMELDDKKEDLKGYLDIVPREDVVVDVDSLSTKYPIVDWKTYTLSENFMYYKIIRGDGSSKNYKILSEMLYDFDRQDVMELYRLVKESWSLCGFCKVHILLMQNGIAIHMLTEKKYPLSQEMILKMLSKRLEVDQESTQAYELLKFIRSQVKK
ncbi:hypothetical protein Tco_0140583 [Tanacetum coccineum]